MMAYMSSRIEERTKFPRKNPKKLYIFTEPVHLDHVCMALRAEIYGVQTSPLP